VILAAALCGSGCSLVLATDAVQCSVDADCVARGADFAENVCVEHLCQPPPDPTWACVGHVAAPTGKTIDGKFRLIDVISQAAVKEATIKRCSKLDPGCAEPLETPTVAADGTFSVSFLDTFNGYLEISSASYLPTLYFLDNAVSGVESKITLLTPAMQAGLNATIGVTSDPAKGGVNVSMLDCTGARAADVSFALAPKGAEVGYYAISSAISATATATDSSGNGGFINVAPGTLTLTAKLAKGGTRLAELTTLSRAGAVTFVHLRPSPLSE
jgi:hypothetical protein